MKKVFNIILIICGGVLLVFFGSYTVMGIIRMVESDDFATYFMETLVLFLPVIAGAIYIFLAIGGIKSESSPTRKRIIPLIVAVILAFLGMMYFFTVAQISIIILFSGLIAPIIYLIYRIFPVKVKG
jgi:lysylphosphatidylglycerol synthetase-like protein (DUF2156 family)